MSRIELKHIDKFYGSNHVLRDINLTIDCLLYTLTLPTILLV